MQGAALGAGSTPSDLMSGDSVSTHTSPKSPKSKGHSALRVSGTASRAGRTFLERLCGNVDLLAGLCDSVGFGS